MQAVMSAQFCIAVDDKSGVPNKTQDARLSLPAHG